MLLQMLLNVYLNIHQINHSRYPILVDVGWYPEGNPHGEYGLEVIKDHDWSNPLESFSTNDKDEMVAKIEQLLQQVIYCAEKL